jgi:TonB family protein
MKFLISIIISICIHVLFLVTSSSILISSKSEEKLQSNFRIRTLIEFKSKKRKGSNSYKKNSEKKSSRSKESKLKVNNYLTKVRRIIEKLKFKNTKAKKLKLKGEVKLSFKINSFGQITDIRIIESSRIVAIDQSALNTLGRVEALPKPPSEIARRGESIVFSIIYE